MEFGTKNIVNVSAHLGSFQLFHRPGGTGWRYQHLRVALSGSSRRRWKYCLKWIRHRRQCSFTDTSYFGHTHADVKLSICYVMFCFAFWRRLFGFEVPVALFMPLPPPVGRRHNQCLQERPNTGLAAEEECTVGAIIHTQGTSMPLLNHTPNLKK